VCDCAAVATFPPPPSVGELSFVLLKVKGRHACTSSAKRLAVQQALRLCSVVDTITCAWFSKALFLSMVVKRL
jgi:hypothetical protein